MSGKKIPVADGHTHSNPVRGMGAENIAAKFRSAGGWFMALVSLSPWAYGIEFNGFDSYKQMIDLHIRECMYASKQGIKTACLAGFHPADIDKLTDKFKLNPLEVFDLAKKVIDYEIDLCREGILDGIGEIGRQHYKTFPIRAILAQYILEYVFQKASDYNCIIHLHLEQEGDTTIALVEEALRRAGADKASFREKIVFHHSKPGLTVKVAEKGFSSTLPGIPQLMIKVLGSIDPVFILESDHIDDPARPGAVVYPWIMASAFLRLVESRHIDEDYAYKVNVDNVRKVYGIEP